MKIFHRIIATLTFVDCLTHWACSVAQHYRGAEAARVCLGEDEHWQSFLSVYPLRNTYMVLELMSYGENFPVIEACKISGRKRRPGTIS